MRDPADIGGPARAARLAGGVGRRPGPRDAALREARVCYDHLAGVRGVRLHDAMVAQGVLVATQDGIALSPAGRARLVAEGIDIAALDSRPRPLCRACLDWSERRPHLAGSLGAALLRHFIARGWLRRDSASRAVHVTPQGEAALAAFAAGPRRAGVG
ncbi:MAG: hypothetical protein IT555_03255 [Acetobacteraceae bacterium]|nr:hypothetical protein [Acetobacteraceae bacterium]